IATVLVEYIHGGNGRVLVDATVTGRRERGKNGVKRRVPGHRGSEPGTLDAQVPGILRTAQGNYQELPPSPSPRLRSSSCSGYRPITFSTREEIECESARALLSTSHVIAHRSHVSASAESSAVNSG